jgi:hypothetical protein
MSDESVILINVLKVKPEKRDALVALLKHLAGRASSSKTVAGRTEPSRRSLVLVGVWKRTPPTR